jgi:hypothetical protein
MKLLQSQINSNIKCLKNKKIDVLVIYFGFYSIVYDFKQLKKRGGSNVLLSM